MPGGTKFRLDRVGADDQYNLDSVTIAMACKYKYLCARRIYVPNQ